MTDHCPEDCYTAHEVFARYHDWYWSGEPERTVLHSDSGPLGPQDQAAHALLQALIGGEIQPLARDPSTGDLVRITPHELCSSAFPERPFYGLAILATNGALSKFNGRNMFMRKEQVDRWFEGQRADSSSTIPSDNPLRRNSVKRHAGAPTIKREAAKTAIRKRWPAGIPPEFSNAAVQAQITEDLRVAGGPTVSPRTIDHARADLASNPQK